MTAADKISMNCIPIKNLLLVDGEAAITI